MIKIFDNEGKTADRYVVGIETENGWDVYTMSEKPQSPVGVNGFAGTVKTLEAIPSLEKKINFEELPKQVRVAITNRLQGYTGK